MSLYVWSLNRTDTVRGEFLYKALPEYGVSPYLVSDRTLGAWSIPNVASRDINDTLTIGHYKMESSSAITITYIVDETVTHNQVIYDFLGYLEFRLQSGGNLTQTNSYTGNILYARPEANRYDYAWIPVYRTRACTLTCNGNGGTPATRTVSFRSGGTVTLPSAPTRTGYVFVGWEIGTVTYAAGASVTLYDSTTATAQWTELLVLFDPNGGSCDVTSKHVVTGQTYGELPTPTRSAYSFLGWFTEADGGTQITAATIVTATAEHTLYAHWARIEGNGHLIYAEDSEASPEPGAATIYITWQPEEWTCEEYDYDHRTTLDATTSWGAVVTDATAATTIDFSLAQIKSAAAHTVATTIKTSCSAKEYSEVDATLYIVVQQRNVGTWWIKVSPPLTITTAGDAEYSSTAVISSNGSRITGIALQEV